MEAHPGTAVANTRRPKNDLFVALGVYGALALVLLGATLENFDHHGAKDWNSFLGQAEAELTSLRDYGQFPLWNPWRGGGQPSLGNPQSMFFSPVTPLAWIFGVVTAFKLVLWPVFLLGCLGMWAFAGHLGLSGLPRLVPGLVFFGSSLFPLYLCAGIPSWVFGMSLLPWLMLYYRRATNDWRHVVLAGALYGALLLCGSVYHFLFFPLLLGLDAVALGLSRRSVRPVITLGAIGFVGCALIAIRLFPVVELFLSYPREVPGTARYVAVSLIPRVFIGSDLPDLSILNGPWVESGATMLYWVNAGSYIGVIAVLLALIGAVCCARSTWIFSLVASLFLWMSLGSSVRFSLWDVVHGIPVLSSTLAPARLIIVVTFALAVLAGFGFRFLDQSAARLPRLARWQRLLPIVLLLAMVSPMLYVNAPIAATAFTVEPAVGDESTGWFSSRRERPPFRQAAVPARAAQWQGPAFEAVLHNYGNVNVGREMHHVARVHPLNDPEYRGEAYLLSGRGNASIEVTPNVLRLQADVPAPDLLVINQAFLPGWVTEGTVSEKPLPSPRQLLAIEVPAGSHAITLSYRPFGFRLGAFVSALSCVLALTYLRLRSA